MKGISAIVVMILILLISVSLVGLGYIFFTEILATVTTTGEESISQTVVSMLSRMTIESVTAGNPGNIYVRNTGKVNLTDFAVYIDDVRDVSATAPGILMPGDVGTITTTGALASTQVVKVTTAQGLSVIESVP